MGKCILAGHPPLDSAENRTDHAAVQKYRQHWWRRRNVTWGQTLAVETTSIVLCGASSQGATSEIKYSASVVRDSSGNLSLNGSYSLWVSYDTYTNANALNGKYILWGTESGKNVAYYVTSNASHGWTSSEGNWYTVTTSGQRVLSVPTYGAWTYLQSASRSAYPDSGESGGYEYEYLGIPFERMPMAARIESGAYVGTGVFGVQNPTTLTFGFKPRLVICTSGASLRTTYRPNLSNISSYDGSFLWVEGNTYVDSGNGIWVTQTGTSLSWYGNNAMSQLNEQNVMYHYLAIG